MRRALLLVFATLLLSACADTHDCSMQTNTTSGMVLAAYTDPNGNNVEGTVPTDECGIATVTVPSSVDCGSVNIKGLPGDYLLD